MKRYTFLRSILFAVFFVVGASALTAVLLYPDMVQHYKNKQHYKALQESNIHLDELSIDYDMLTYQLLTDPNLVERIRIATLGKEPNTTDTAYPRPTAEQLAVATQALNKQTQNQPPAPELPKWITRCQSPALRATLFIAGVGLILISFICFNAPKNRSKQTD